MRGAVFWWAGGWGKGQAAGVDWVVGVSVVGWVMGCLGAGGENGGFWPASSSNFGGFYE
jgi:hypothetical protein